MIRSFSDKQREKAKIYEAEQKVLAEQAEQDRIRKEEERWNKEWEAKKAEEARIVTEELHQKQQERLAEQERRDEITRQRIEEWEIERQNQLIKEEYNKKVVAEERAQAMKRYIASLSEKPKPKKKTSIHEGMPMNHASTWQLTWQSFSTHPKIINLPMSEKKRLFKIAQSKELEQLNRQPNTLGSGDSINYALQFTGDTNSATRRGDLVVTDFNPDTYNLNLGFTISYWVRPDELGGDMFAIGRKAHNNARFTFGISSATKGYFGVGSNQSERSWETMLDTAGIDKATHLTQDGSDWKLTIGKWYHFAVTYANRDNTDSGALRKIYMNGQQIWGTGVSDPTHAGNINWSDTGRLMDHNLSFGMRAVRGSGTNTNHNNGWACALDEVAIYNTEKDASFIADVYNDKTNYDHTGKGGLVGYWKFNEGNGTHVEDLSGNGNHGLLTNDSIGADGGAAFASGIPTWIQVPENYKGIKLYS